MLTFYDFGAAATDDLSDLFGSGETGDWWIFDNVHTNATADGQSITAATGIVNGLVMTNPATAPTLASLSGLWAMRTHFGSNDRLHYNFGSDISQPGTIILALGSSETTTHVICTGSSTTKRWQISDSSGGDIIMFAGSTLDSTINENYGTKAFTAEFNGASSVFRSNGTQTASGNAGTQATNQFTLGALYDGSFPGDINFYAALFINRLLTSTERDRAERLLGSYAGLSW